MTIWLTFFINLLIVVGHGFTKDVDGLIKFYNLPRENEILFVNKLIEKFPSTSVLISTRELKILEDIATIEKKNLIILRNLKLDEIPDLKITFLNSNLEYLSMRIGLTIGNGDVTFLGEIYIDECVEPIGDVSYNLKNFNGYGIVGFEVEINGGFKSTNYLMTYEEDETILNGTYWIDKNSRRYQINDSYLPAKEIETGIRTTLDAILKKRLDATLAEIKFEEIFGLKKSSNFESIKKRTNEYYDGLIDNILNRLNDHMRYKNYSRINIPDIEIPFSKKIIGLTISGKVIAREGWFKDLTTFVRRGPITVDFGAKDIAFLGSLGLDNLEVGYDACAIRVAGGLGPRVKISASIDDNEFRIGVAVNYREKKISLDNFELTNLSNINIRVGGLGPFDWLASKIVNRILNWIKEDILPIIEAKIKGEIRELLKNFDGDKIIGNLFISSY